MDSVRPSENEDFPVRDTSVNKIIRKEMNGGNMKAAINRQAISKMDRRDLEEKYSSLYDENIILKKYGLKRDEEIKRLCSIQARLENDRKKLMSDPSVKRLSDAYYQQQIEHLYDKNQQLERTNEGLKMKLTVSRQKNLMSQATLTTYPHIPSKIDSGIQKQYVDSRVIKNIRTIIYPSPSRKSSSRIGTTESFNQVDFNAFEPTDKTEHMSGIKMEEGLTDVNEKKNEEHEKVIEALKEQIKQAEKQYEAELSQIRSRINEDQKQNVKENVNRIRLEREIKEKNIKFQQLHDQYANLQEKMNLLRTSNEQAVNEIDDIQDNLRMERAKVAELQKQLECGKSNKVLLMEQQARVADLERECEILKESNSRLMSTALDVEKENEWKKREAGLRNQIYQLEAAMQADVGDKGNLIDRMTQLKEELDKTKCELRDVKAKNEIILKKNEELNEKTSVFGENGVFSNEEFIEALALMKRMKKRDEACGEELDFMMKMDVQECSVEKQLRELEAQQVETVNELEKTRNLLVCQYKINNDYKNELELTNKKMEENRREFDAQLDKYSQIIDIKSERIKKLEAQLRDVAYGTKKIKFDTEDRINKYREEEDEEDLIMENGQNLFEIHIRSLMLTEDCLRMLDDLNPSMFCTWEFYDFELQSTPILPGPRMDYGFTSQYIVLVDDFFIHYLQKGSCTLELHQCLGSDYKTVAAGSIRLNGLLERSSGRIHGTLNLTGVSNVNETMSCGVLEYWVRLRVPMEQALRLYKERCKALGYLESNLKQTTPIVPLDESAAKRPPNNINHLTIRVMSCKNVKASNCAKQPSVYLVYKFYDFPDHDSPIIHSSNDPIFDDKRTYPVAMTSQLDCYLKSQVLKIYLFDDTDPNLESHLGIVSVPLISLSHDEEIRGEFEIIGKEGSSNGTMEIALSWQYFYISPLRVTTPPTQQKSLKKPTCPKRERNPRHRDHRSPLNEPSDPSEPPDDSEVDEVKVKKERLSNKKKHSLLKSQNKTEPKSSTQVKMRSSRGDQRHDHISKKSFTVTNGNMEDKVDTTPEPPELSESLKSPSEGDNMVIPLSQTSKKSMTSKIEELQSPTEKKHSLLKSQNTTKPKSSFDLEVETRSPRDDRPQDRTSKKSVTNGNMDKIINPEPNEPSKSLKSPSEVDDRDMPLSQTSKKSMTSKSMTSKIEERQSPAELTIRGPSENSGNKELDEDVDDQSTSDKSLMPSTSPLNVIGPPETSSLNENNRVKLTKQGSESDDSDVVVPKRHSQKTPEDTVTITVSHVKLTDDSPLLDDPAIQKLYVAYEFFGEPPEQTETPFSLPKPTYPNKPISFNFTRAFRVDKEENVDKRYFVASMLMKEGVDDGRLRFTLISEPIDDEGDCEDVGVAYVSLPKILEKGRDVVDDDVPIQSSSTDGTIVGYMGLTVQCLDTLKNIQKEMQRSTLKE